MKFCKDCKYHRYTEWATECVHPASNYHTNLVSGYMYFRDCSDMRNNIVIKNSVIKLSICGENAKYFEQKKAWWKLW